MSDVLIKAGTEILWWVTAGNGVFQPAGSTHVFVPKPGVVLTTRHPSPFIHGVVVSTRRFRVGRDVGGLFLAPIGERNERIAGDISLPCIGHGVSFTVEHVPS